MVGPLPRLVVVSSAGSPALTTGCILLAFESHKNAKLCWPSGAYTIALPFRTQSWQIGCVCVACLCHEWQCNGLLHFHLWADLLSRRSRSFSSVFLVSVWRPAWSFVLHGTRSFDAVVQDSGLMAKSFKSRLSTSLYRRHGLPVFRVPLSRTPCKSMWGIRSIGMRLTWPAQRRRINLSLEESGPEPVSLKTSSLDILSCQVLPRMNLRFLVWNALSLDSWDL